MSCESDDSPGAASSGAHGRQRSGPAGRQRIAPAGRHSVTASTDHRNTTGSRDYGGTIVRDGYPFGGRAKSESMWEKAANLDTRSERERVLDAASRRSASRGYGSTVVRNANPYSSSDSSRDSGMSFSYDRDAGGFVAPCGDRSAEAKWGKS